MQRIATSIFVLVVLGIIGLYLFLPGGPLSAEARCARNVEAWLEELSPLLIEWSDLTTVAASTSRIALAPLIRDMQAVRREVMGIEPPECAGLAYLSLTVGMDAEIEAFTGFMAQDPDSAISNSMAKALDSHRRFWREVDDLQKTPDNVFVAWIDLAMKEVASLIPASDLPRATHINGYDPESGARLRAVHIIDRGGTVVASLEHGNPITVTKIEGANCFVTTEAGIKGIIACDYTQLPER